MYCQKISTWDVMHDGVYCRDEAANHQLPVAVAFWIIQKVSVDERSSLMQHLMQIHCSTQSLWMWWSHSTHAHSVVSTTPTDSYSEVILVHTCTFQSSLLGCQVTLMSHKLFSFNGWTFSKQTSYNVIIYDENTEMLIGLQLHQKLSVIYLCLYYKI